MLQDENSWLLFDTTTINTLRFKINVNFLLFTYQLDIFTRPDADRKLHISCEMYSVKLLKRRSRNINLLYAHEVLTHFILSLTL